ncbi:hypothetical protein KP509_09G007000 [Ceratopteris richardii]|nr:hypothetical protein KP509_09G007000 [Ceratopteris richardii]
MQHEGVSPDSLTFTSILKACGTVKAEVKGKQIHDKIVQQGLLDGDVKIGTAIVDMYAKCGNLIKAQHVLEELPSRNIVTWSALIAGYAEQGQGEKALSCFEMMKHEGIVPNAVTFVSALKACGSINAAEKGKQIHDEITRQGLLRNNHVLATALIDMYAKCGALKRAKRVLDELPSRNVINWSALIAAYAQQGQDEQALSSFERLQDEGLSPTSVTFASTLKSCGSLKAAEKGEKIHYEIERRGLLHNDHILGTAVIDMYAKCGVLSKAWTVLEELPYQCVSMWAALIGGFVQHDKGEQALHCFKLMQQKGISPNVATFSCILNACSHLGLVEDCFRHYSSMRCKHGIDPDFEHTTCMVDLFGRAGHIDRAVKLTMEMSFSDYPILWYALMSACHKWSNMNIGRWAFRHSVQLDAQDAGVCNLMANMYKANGVESYVDIDSCTDQ